MKGDIIMNIKNQILDAIDDINIITAECEYNTICEMYNSYDKASLILEYYEGDNVDAFNVFDDTHSFYQESSVSDKMKKSGAKYNTFMKIITFIPRLVKALFQTIKEMFKKTKLSKELQKAPKEVKEKLTTVFDKKKDKKKRIATVASLILGAGAVGVATKVGVHKLRERSFSNGIDKLNDTIVKLVNEIEDRNMSLGDLTNYREDFKDKINKIGGLFVVIADDTHTFKERKRAIRDSIVLLNELKKDVMKIEAVPKDKKENVVKEINKLENGLTDASNVSDKNKLNEVIDSSVTDTSSTNQNNQEKIQEPTPEVEKIAEKIVDKIDTVLEDINKRYKVLVNKLYNHDSIPLPSEDKQSVGVEFEYDNSDVLYLVDELDIGVISAYCMADSLRATDELLILLTHQLNFHDDINKIDEKINELFEKFKNKKKERYFRDHSTYYFSKVQLHDYINHLEEVVKDNEKRADEFNKRSDKDKELLMEKPSVQNAIKALNNESKFYRDIFYEFLSLFHEVTKLIDNTYNNLTYNISDRYKFNEKAEKVSKINTDIPISYS